VTAGLNGLPDFRTPNTMCTNLRMAAQIMTIYVLSGSQTRQAE